MSFLIRLVATIYDGLFLGLQSRSSIRRQEQFEQRIRLGLGNLLNKPDVSLRGNHTSPHPRPFGYVTAKLQIGPTELQFADGRAEVVLSHRSNSDSEGKTIWNNVYDFQLFGDSSARACLDQCLVFVREHWADFEQGRRPS